MHQLKSANILFVLAALLFVAKPFLGFDTFNYSNHPVKIHNLLVKVFSKRKPDDLEDAKNKRDLIHKQLKYPPFPQLLTILSLLAILFTFLFKPGVTITNGFLKNLKTSRLIHPHSYLLTGKLSI